MNCELIFKENIGHYVKIHLIPTEKTIYGILEHVHGYIFLIRNFYGLIEMVRLEDIRAIEAEKKINEENIKAIRTTPVSLKKKTKKEELEEIIEEEIKKELGVS